MLYPNGPVPPVTVTVRMVESPLQRMVPALAVAVWLKGRGNAGPWVGKAISYSLLPVAGQGRSMATTFPSKRNNVHRQINFCSLFVIIRGNRFATCLKNQAINHERIKELNGKSNIGLPLPGCPAKA